MASITPKLRSALCTTTYVILLFGTEPCIRTVTFFLNFLKSMAYSNPLVYIFPVKTLYKISGPAELGAQGEQLRTHFFGW